MARTIRDAKLETREARRRLSAQPKPHWRTLRPGQLHLGYCCRRKGSAGYWTTRTYIGVRDAGSPYRIEKLPGIADDFEDANGQTVLSFAEAQDKALARQHTAEGAPQGRLTVRKAVTNYVEYLRAEGRPTKDTEWRVAAHILPKLGDIEVAALTSDKLRRWLAALASAGVRLRTKKGKAQKHKAVPEDDEAVRRRRSSANRVLTILKAALNFAYDEKHVSSRDAWGRRVKPFEGVDVARLRYLSVAEAKRFLNACDPQFRLLVRGALETGARYSELARLQVQDFHPDAGAIHIRKSKSGKARHAVLTADGVGFFREVCIGRPGSTTMFERNGKPWRTGDQARLMKAASENAKLTPPVTFHGLRHTWGSLSAMNGVSLQIISQNMGHADSRMAEKHYAHLAPSHVAAVIRAGAPRFGKVKASNVVPLREPT